MTAPAVGSANNAVRVIFWGGLLAGTFDLIFAFVYYGPKLGVLQSIAAGLLGRTVFQGGIPAALLGGFLHFLVAMIWAGLFWGLGRRLPALMKYPIPTGLIYGLVVFYGMNGVVLPLSALHTKAWPLPFAPWPVATHMLLVGLPIAWSARKFS